MTPSLRPLLALCAMFVAANLSHQFLHIACAADGATSTDSNVAGISDPGKAVRIQLSPDTAANHTLIGPANRLQLITTAQFDSGQSRDWTQRMSYHAEPAGVITIDDAGVAAPIGDGVAIVTASTNGTDLKATTKISVQQFASPPRVNFANEIVPIFTKLGCNNGGCHGKSGGQNGFALSLLGFEPQQDFDFIVKESRGRRVFPAAPEQSLLLEKATGVVPHGGGARLELDSDEYRLMRLWLEQGMPYGEESDPKVESVAVEPGKRTLPLTGDQQLRVVATYTDGSRRDVTRQSQYTSNNTELANVSEKGLVELKGKPGVVAVMVRYQGQVDAFLATVPLGAKIESLPPERNLVDKFVFQKLTELGLPPSDLCDDSTFIRRVTIDIAGRLPTLKETENFLADKSPIKRNDLIERLLSSDDYANYFAQKWTAILRNRADRTQSRAGNFLFHDWVRQSMANNLSYDKFVSKLVTASGSVRDNPAANWHLKLGTADQRVEDTAQVFLGQRIQCAKCHHHPFEKWGQDDYWGMTAFYATVSVKKGVAVYTKRQLPQARNPNSNQLIPATSLDCDPLEMSLEKDPRIELAKWMTAPDNPFFAKTLVNRYWKHFMGIGIVEPEDDMRATNPPTNPELLDALANEFVKSDFDLKNLIRTICNSTTYQLSSNPNEFNSQDHQSYSKFAPRRLAAEVMLDGMDLLLGTTTSFQNLPTGTLAKEIPDHGGVTNMFLDAFGRPAAASACECERNGEISMAQSLHLLNSDDIYNKLQSSRAQKFAETTEGDAAKITEIYLRAFSRPPTDDELGTMLQFVSRAEPNRRKEAFEDVLWTITNTKEFMFNH